MKKEIFKKIISVVMALSIGLSLPGCKKHPNDELPKASNLGQNIEELDIESKELDDRFIYATADFSVNLFKESAIEEINAGNNVLIAPQSIIMAMSMTTNGAAGNTKTELQNTMYGGMEVLEYNKYMKDYSGRLTADEYVDFYLANSVWIKDDPDLKIKEDFLQICKSYYDAGVYSEPFDCETTNKMNSWVKNNTNNMIDGIVEEIQQDAVIYLVNATAFEGEWLVEYKDNQVIEDYVFTNSAGIEENVVMLRSLEEYYLSDDMAKGFIKYYKGGNYAFLAMLPDEGVSLDEYVSSLTGEKLVETYNNRELVDVGVGIPEFTYEYEKELSKDFIALGVADAFDESSADFSNMATTTNGRLVINRVLHKTYIELDRKGTKASAATAVEMTKESCSEPDRYETVILDRPFYYAIIDCKTGLPVFMGVVNSVN